MIEGLPLYVSLVFFFTTLTTIWFLLASARPAARESLPFKILVFVLPLWLVVTGFLSTTDFYRQEAMPPRVVAFAVAPAILLIAVYFVFFRKSFIAKLSRPMLTILSVVRFPVELVLHWLHEGGQVPQIMTFEGWNFDILSGISAPIIYWLAFRKGGTNRPLLIGWNLLALGLLTNIITIAVLSFKGPMQRLAFDQPNVGVTYLPFIWLPAIVVPIVLFAHLASLYNSLRATDTQNI
jgi:hypothetical protein